MLPSPLLGFGGFFNGNRRVEPVGSKKNQVHFFLSLIDPGNIAHHGYTS
jgi:hypothetical protein